PAQRRTLASRRFPEFIHHHAQVERAPFRQAQLAILPLGCLDVSGVARCAGAHAQVKANVAQASSPGVLACEFGRRPVARPATGRRRPVNRQPRRLRYAKQLPGGELAKPVLLPYWGAGGGFRGALRVESSGPSPPTATDSISKQDTNRIQRP